MPIDATDGRNPPLFASRRQVGYSLGLLAILLAFYGGLYLLWSVQSSAYTAVFRFMGIRPWVEPFLDLGGTLSWGDCHHAGIDVFVTNPCDPYGRLFNYSPFLLDLPMHSIGTHRLIAAGVVHDLVFLAMLPLVFRPDSRRTLAIALAASVSPMVLFGVERANLDLFVFALIGFAAVFATRGRMQRLLSYAIFAIAGLTKLYPFVLLGLIVRERVRLALALGAVAAVGLAAFTVHYWDELVKVRPLLPAPSFGDMFGAMFLPSLIGRLPGLRTLEIATLTVACAAIAAVIAVRLAKRLRSTLPPLDWNATNFALLATGALLTIGCFFTGPSAGYRAAMLVFVIPGLAELRTLDRNRNTSRVFSFALAAALFCLWEEFFRHVVDRIGAFAGLTKPAAMAFFSVREGIWWGLICVLAALVGLFVTQSLARRLELRTLKATLTEHAETR